MKLFNRWTDVLAARADDGAKYRDRLLDEARGRLTPRRRSSWRGRLVTLFAGAAGGLALAHLLDPDRGRARRARYADQLAALGRRTAERAQRSGRSLKAEAQARVGAQLAGIASRGADSQAAEDATVHDRLESELFRDTKVPKGMININVEEGVAVLRGEVDSLAAAKRLIAKARTVPGVVRVDSLLHLPGEPAPAAQPREHPAHATAGPTPAGEEGVLAER